MSSSHDAESSHAEIHVSPVRTYLLIFSTLLALTGLTIWVAFQDLGRGNDFVALAIASIKMTLVVLWFMHVKYSTRLTKLAVVSGVLCLIILFAFTLSDYLTRGWMGVPGK